MLRNYGVACGFFSLAVTGLLLFSGCASSPNSASDSAQMPSGGEAAPASEMAKTASVASPGSPTAGTAQLIKAAASVPRKIIYNAKVELVSDNFSIAQQNLLRLVKTHRGYISDTNVSGTTGAPRQGSWTIRIPETQFEPFMTAVTKLGELQTTQTDSQDVTEEFYDLQARISNKQVEEKRLIEHLNRSTAKLSDILAVEKELSRVRGEIEQMQGRLRLLANLTSLTTVTVTIREVKDYVAPKPATFNTQIARTFSESLGQLGAFGKSIILVFVALVPWLVVMLIGMAPLYFIARRQQKNTKKAP